MTSPSLRARGTMLARISPEDIVIYANAALADYLRASKQDLIGTPLEVLASRCTGELSSCFSRSHSARNSNRLVTDDEGRVFEAKSYSESGVLDIVLDEVTTAASIGGELSTASGVPFDSLTEEELRTARQPERRYLSVGFTMLRDVNTMAERLPPMEARLIVDSFLEEAVDAILEPGGTVGSASGNSILGIFGAPRNFLDHPLRAVKAACATMQKSSALHAGFHREGKEILPCSCGIWTGEALVGTLGGGPSRHYTALGSSVELSEKLCRLARPGEILVPEHTLTHLLRVLPDGWSHLRAITEAEPDLSDFQWTGDDIEPLPEPLRRIIFLVGPGVDLDTSQAEYSFDYLWSLKVPGRDTATPILRVVRMSDIGDSIEFRGDNVIAAQTAQILGKYRLVEVLGTGGMGRVWRGVDRFGNNVAIKVLHSHESVTEAQLKRFRREAEIMARLPHRNICRVYEMNEFEGIQYIAMEYVDGLSLADLLFGSNASSHVSAGAIDLPTLIRSLRLERQHKAGNPDEAAGEEQARAKSKTSRVLPVQQSLSIVLRVCEAIQFAHEHGVLHRDLKPGNILLREDGEPLVADFGLAKIDTPDGSQSLSVSGHVVGTLENMPPEQAESSKDVDERADVYAIGTILFQMLTGRRHFEATGNIVTDAQALRTHEPPRLRTLNARLDVDLEIITLKALRNDPSRRYQSVSALRADLERYRRGEVITAKPVSALDLARKIVQRNRAATAISAVSLAVIIGMVTVSVWSLSRQLATETAARKESEQLRSEAENHKRLAEEKRLEAESKEHVATEQLQRIKDLLAEKQAAEDAVIAARASTRQALAETEAERGLREKAERERAEQASLLQQTIKQIEDIQAPVATTPETPFEPKPLRDPAVMAAAQRAIGEALTIFHFELSPFELQRYEKNPDPVVQLLSRAQDLVSEALGANVQFREAWMIKGRLHMAAMEFPPAVRAFSKAGELTNTPRARNPSKFPDDDPATMLGFAENLSTTGISRNSEIIDALMRSGNPDNHATGNILRFLAGKPTLIKSGLPKESPLGREPGTSELALTLMLDNNLDQVPTISGDRSAPGGLSATLDDNAANLSALRGITVSSLTLKNCASVDWETLATLPLESLDLSDSPIESLPPGPRSFLRLRSLNLANTRIRSLEAVRMMPQLETLNLAGSDATELSPLLNCRRLRTLDLSATNPSSLRTLLMLPLESLTLSPLLITDKASLLAIRGHRTLRSLRTPDDPPTHAPLLFWQKLENGHYDTPTNDEVLP
ncbi:MAG: protein kinase [Terrimicrobiaceae bacterium]